MLVGLFQCDELRALFIRLQRNFYMVYKCSTSGFDKQLLLGVLFIRSGINKACRIWTDIK